MTKNNQPIDRLDSAHELSTEVRGGLRRLCPVDEPPNRSAMLAGVYQAVGAKEHKMNSITRLFAGQRWYLKTALAVFALAAIAALAFIVPSLDNLKDGPGYQQAWAATNGYQLVYQLAAYPGDPGPDGLCGQLEIPYMDELKAELSEWADARQAALPDPDDRQALVMRIEAGQNGVQVEIGLPGAELELAEELRTAMAAVAGLPEPTISEMTWFYDLEQGIDQNGLSISINNHQFTFPAGTDPEAMKAEIKAWFAAQGKDVDVSVTTTPTGDGTEKRVEVQIGLDCDNCEISDCPGFE